MPTRLQISSFIGLTIFVWLIALWMQGMPVLSLTFVKPFSLVVGIVMGVSVIFNRHAWSWRIFRGWYVKRPDLRGTWRVEIASDWRNPETGLGIAPIVAYAAVTQTLTSLSFRLMTRESKSALIAHCINLEEDQYYRLTGIYRNEPRIELQGVRSDIHHGAFTLEAHGCPVVSLEGHYWTDRGTRGSMKLSARISKVQSTYEAAHAAFSM